ncbi:MAG: tetratricopeptide repeat protein [Ignavibacteriales bacterium]|nr:tetratricopeptide repeat protein [Ignavibacteriales bacterium]
MAAFHFDKGHWEEAIPMFSYLLETSEPRGDVYQKIAYACQMMGNFREAIGYYRKAELFRLRPALDRQQARMVPHEARGIRPGCQLFRTGAETFAGRSQAPGTDRAVPHPEPRLRSGPADLYQTSVLHARQPPRASARSRIACSSLGSWRKPKWPMTASSPIPATKPCTTT